MEALRGAEQYPPDLPLSPVSAFTAHGEIRAGICRPAVKGRVLGTHSKPIASCASKPVSQTDPSAFEWGHGPVVSKRRSSIHRTVGTGVNGLGIGYPMEFARDGSGLNYNTVYDAIA